jgi:hypothetical protein
VDGAVLRFLLLILRLMFCQAPEMFNANSAYSREADIYALGMVSLKGSYITYFPLLIINEL